MRTIAKVDRGTYYEIGTTRESGSQYVIFGECPLCIIHQSISNGCSQTQSNRTTNCYRTTWNNLNTEVNWHISETLNPKAFLVNITHKLFTENKHKGIAFHIKGCASIQLYALILLQLFETPTYSTGFPVFLSVSSNSSLGLSEVAHNFCSSRLTLTSLTNKNKH